MAVPGANIMYVRVLCGKIQFLSLFSDQVEKAQRNTPLQGGQRVGDDDAGAVARRGQAREGRHDHDRGSAPPLACYLAAPAGAIAAGRSPHRPPPRRPLLHGVIR
ncbi:hypothetical protein VPH35_032522 [Triticum aestivum]